MNRCAMIKNRSMADVVLRQTERCRAFWVNGACQYGARCRFLHDEPALPDPDALAAMPEELRTDPLRHVTPLRPGPAVSYFHMSIVSDALILS